MVLQTEIREPNWPKGLYRRDTTYRFKRMVNRKNIIIPLGDSLAEAVSEANRINKKIELGIDVARERRQGSTTVEMFIDTYKRIKSADWKPKTVQRYQAIFDNFLYWLKKRFGRSPSLAEVTYEVAQDYISARKAGPVISNAERKKQNRFNRNYSGKTSKWTIKMERDSLTSVFSEAVKRELMSKNPFAEVKVDRPSDDDRRAIHHPLTEEEQEDLLRAAAKLDRDGGNARFSDILLFLFKTGLREDEVRKLEWDDVKVDWKSSKPKPGLIHIRKKTVVETRRCTLTKGALAKLKKLTQGKLVDELVFPQERSLEKISANLFPIRAKRDLLAIKVRDIEWDTGELIFTRQYEWDPKATNGDVPLGKTAMKLLQRLHQDQKSNFVFAHHDGGACRLDLLSLVKKAQTLTNPRIKGRLRLHDTRHSRAVYLRQKGVPLETIMGMLRHAHISETAVYAPYSLQEGKEAVAKFD